MRVDPVGRLRLGGGLAGCAAVAALCLTLVAPGPVAGEASAPASAVDTSVVDPPTPEQAAENFLDRHRDKIGSPPDPRTKLTKIFDDLRSRDKGTRAAARSELQDILRQLRRPNVVRVYLPPDGGSQGRRPDMVLEIRQRDGTTRLKRREIKTITGLRRNPGDPLKATKPDDVRRSVKSGIKPQPYVGAQGKDTMKAPQLTERLTVGSPAARVPAGGTMVVVVPETGAKAKEVAQRAIDGLNDRLKQPPPTGPKELQWDALEDVDVWSADGSHVGTWVRQDDGTLGPGEEPGGVPAPGGPEPFDPSGGEAADPEVDTDAVEALTNAMTQAAASNPGGIDFSTLELRYLSVAEGDDDATDVEYAFTADQGGSDTTAADGMANAVRASDAFFVWLALPERTFWVNLRPDQPDRVIDPVLGRTEVGRVMLQADMLLKKADARLQYELGARYFRRVRIPAGTCFTYRIWIVPGRAKLRETGDAVYIVDAPLEVRMQPVNLPSVRGTDCAPQSAALRKHNTAIHRRLVVPRLVRTVNNAPEFAPLRRIYLSRVAAAWYREQSAIETTAFSHLIDSGDIERWQLKGAWRPRQTYRAYLRSYNRVEYRYRDRLEVGDTIQIRTHLITGGVDFSKLLRQRLSADAAETLWPGLTETVDRGLQRGIIDQHTKELWVGTTSEVDAPEVAENPTPDNPYQPDASTAVDDPFVRDVAPYLVPVSLAAGVALVVIAIRNERRRRQAMRGLR